jgi:amino acid permease
MKREVFSASLILVGAIVGAGLFVLPGLLATGGWLPFLASLLVFGGGMILLHLLLIEVILRTKEPKYFTGYVGQYLGKTARRTSFLYVFPGLVGTLLVYALMAGEFLALIVQPWLSLTAVWGSLIFLFSLSFFIFRGGKTADAVQKRFTLFLLIVLLATLGYALPRLNWGQFSFFQKPLLLSLPGVVFFSLLGWNALPAMVRHLKKKESKKKVGKIIVFTLSGAAFLYFLFSLAVAGLGINITDWTSLSQLPVSAFYLAKVLALIGLLASLTSFLSLGNYLKNSLVVDYHFPYWLAAMGTILSPLFLYLLGFQQLLSLMGLVGALMGAIQGWVIVFVFLKARKKGDRSPEYIIRRPRLALAFMTFTLTAVIAFQLFASFGN